MPQNPADALVFAPLADGDLEALHALTRRWRPDLGFLTPAFLRGREAARLPGEYGHREWALRSGARAGALLLDFPHSENRAGWLRLNVLTHPHDAALRDALLRRGVALAREAGAHTLIARVQEGSPDDDACRAHGFGEHDRTVSSELGLTDGPWRTHAAPPVPGVRVQTLADVLAAHGQEWGDNEAIQHRYYDLEIELLLSVPATTPVVPWTFEVWQARVGHALDPAGVALAVTEGGEWVGLCELYREASPGVLHNGLTGVRAAWRGRGLALALKLCALHAASARGFVRARTLNHTANAPMLAVNRRLGFVPEPASLVLLREL